MDNSHIVVIYGSNRAGKDTFADYLQFHLTDFHISAIKYSSIDWIREFYLKTKQRLSDNPNIKPTGELDATDRQALADIKAALDTSLDWTVRNAISNAIPSTVLLYQVREIDNIKKIRDHCAIHAINFHAVFIWRPDHNPAGASTDIYQPEDWKQADVVIVNKEVHDLNRSALMLASKINTDFLSAHI